MHDHSRFQRDIDDVTGVSLSLSLYYYYSQKSLTHNIGSASALPIMRKVDENVIDYACQNACVKVANVKSVKKGLPGEGVWGRTLSNAHKNTCVYQLIASGEGTSNKNPKSRKSHAGLLGQRKAPNCFQTRPLQAYPKK